VEKCGRARVDDWEEAEEVNKIVKLTRITSVEAKGKVLVILIVFSPE